VCAFKTIKIATATAKIAKIERYQEYYGVHDKMQ
jgi:hypothetical protein